MSQPDDSLHASADVAEAVSVAPPETAPPVVAERLPTVDLSWVTTDLIRHKGFGQDPEIIR